VAIASALVCSRSAWAKRRPRSGLVNATADPASPAPRDNLPPR
jgi:hypothetical protein